MLQPYECILVGAAMQLPLLWWILMFTIQLVHWWIAFIDDMSPTPNILMNYAMLHWFGYRTNTIVSDDGLYVKYDENQNPYRSDGALAIWVPPTVLFLVPVAIVISINYYMIVGIIALAVGITFGTRMLRRLAKIFNKHTNKQHLEK